MSNALDKVIADMIAEGVAKANEEKDAEIKHLKRALLAAHADLDSCAESKARAVEARNSMEANLRDVAEQLQEFAAALQIALLA